MTTALKLVFIVSLSLVSVNQLRHDLHNDTISFGMVITGLSHGPEVHTDDIFYKDNFTLTLQVFLFTINTNIRLYENANLNSTWQPPELFRNSLL
jgi:hypothetical protein